MPSPRSLSRRQVLTQSAALATGAAAATKLGVITAIAQSAAPAEWQSTWTKTPDRIWLGPELWANPMQDWRVAGGKIECINAALDRNVHLLTRQLGEKGSSFALSVKVSRVGGKKLSDGKGSAGFRVGIQGPLKEYRNSLWFGSGLNAGFTWDGALFIGDFASGQPGKIKLDTDVVELRLTASPAVKAPDADSIRLALSAHDAGGNALGEVVKTVPASQLIGNIALVANFGAAPGPGAGKGKKKAENAEKNAKAARTNSGMGEFAFSDWRVSGERIVAHPEHAFGPILFNQYTLSQGVMKMTAQMPPIGLQDPQTVALQVKDGSAWKTIAEEKIHPDARTATFRIANWNDRVDHPYQLVYGDHVYGGTIRHDPVDKPELSVLDVSCNIHAAFPNRMYVDKCAALKPDLIAFVGDQFYENCGGYGVQRQPVEPAMVDYLRKWYFHGWTWREMTKDIPSVSLPDDHDVYQGNIWGEGGAPRQGVQEAGGYDMDPRWVNVVHRTQTAHHPDPFDPTPIKQNISVYYGPLTWGRVSFAIIADRQFKTAPVGEVTNFGGPRGDHIDKPFNPKEVDKPGLELLGERQMKFLREWAADWKGADIKAVISQTIFTGMATHHGNPNGRLFGDYDQNGWPQSARNAALREMRKAFAVHIAGDQHLPAVIHYGVDEQADAGIALAGPAVNVGYPRWFLPDQPPLKPGPHGLPNTGDYLDLWGNPMRVLAVYNPVQQPTGKHPHEVAQEKGSGISIVRFNKATREIRIEAWPFLADPTKDPQWPGWPVKTSVLEQYNRKPAGKLPSIAAAGIENPVVQVIEEKSGEILYTLRAPGKDWQPPVFAKGKYTVRIYNPDTGVSKETKGVEAQG